MYIHVVHRILSYSCFVEKYKNCLTHMREHKYVERLQYSKIRILRRKIISLVFFYTILSSSSVLSIDNSYLFDKSLFAVTTFQENVQRNYLSDSNI